MINYRKSIQIAQMLNLDKNHAETLTKAVDAFVPSFLGIDKKKVLRFGLDLGLFMASSGL
jgi:hypothetical protein